MLHAGTSAGAVVEKLLEFDRVASILEMSEAERLGILNVSGETYARLRQGVGASFQDVKPELERRLSYALPLMRRLAGNSPMQHLPLSGVKPAAQGGVASRR